MSTQIVFRIKAYHYPSTFIEGETLYVILEESGANNVIVNRTGLVARDWYMVANGPEYHVWGAISRWCGQFSGGMSRFAHGNTKQGYRETIHKAIDRYGETLKTAEPLANALDLEGLGSKLHQEIVLLLAPKKEVANP